MKFRTGAKDGFPIALGYFAVAISFGVASVGYGFPFWMPILVSLTNYTGSGQALGVQLMSVASTTLLELVVAMLAINLRYALMSVTISQKLDKRVTLGQRFLLAFGMTDENFAAALMRNREITFSYMIGLEATAFAGWVGGTIVGAVVGDFLPPLIMTAFKIALPAMFIAIIVPPCRKSRANVVVVAISVAMSCLFYYVPVINTLSKGWVYVICGLSAAVAGALIFPVRDEEEGGDVVEPTDETGRQPSVVAAANPSGFSETDDGEVSSVASETGERPDAFDTPSKDAETESPDDLQTVLPADSVVFPEDAQTHRNDASESGEALNSSDEGEGSGSDADSDGEPETAAEPNRSDGEGTR